MRYFRLFLILLVFCSFGSRGAGADSTVLVLPHKRVVAPEWITCQNPIGLFRQVSCYEINLGLVERLIYHHGGIHVDIVMTTPEKGEKEASSPRVIKCSSGRLKPGRICWNQMQEINKL